MRYMKTASNYWFSIEPYVFIGFTNKCILLYNTIDGYTIESDQKEVIELLRELLKEENCGVTLLTNERYKQKNINDFIVELRKNYMGDIIDVALSKGKPVQLLPFYNFPDKSGVYKKHNFSSLKNIMENLFEISVHVNATTNLTELISFLQSIPGTPIFNIIGNIKEVKMYEKFLSYFDKRPSPKNIVCSYKDVFKLQPTYENNFAYRVSVRFPIDDMQQLYRSIQILLVQTFPIEYIFDITSDEDYLHTEQIIEQFKIEKYRLNPVFTGNNLVFFEKNVFLTKEDILSTTMTIKDFFTRQSINLYDFGKINIMPNGDTYANLNHPVLGNIYSNNIYEILHKEIEEGKSWLHVRNQAPCNKCVYQWLCPPPSNYEIVIGRPNLCFVNE